MWEAVLTDYLDMCYLIMTQRNLDKIRNNEKKSGNLENNSLLNV
jgi:hypothetical protein